MRWMKSAAVVLVLLALAASAGECVSLLLADGHAMACCAGDECAMTSGAHECCNVPSPGAAPAFQAETRTSHPNIWAVAAHDGLANLAWPAPNRVQPSTLESLLFHDPPAASDVSLPLLI